MKFLIVLALIGLVVASDEDLRQVSEANDVFTANMFAEVLREKPNQSVVFSAFSVLHPLAELALASTGESHDELLRAIGMPSDNVTRALFPLASAKLKEAKGIELRTASKVYIPIGFELDEAFATDLKSVFESEVKNIDFTKKEEAAEEINHWVAENTNNRIKDLVDPNGLDELTRAVLVNAIYFKGTWSSKFKKTATENNKFFKGNGKSITLPTMHKTASFKYGESEDLDAKLLELPYEGGQAKFLIVLPNKVDGLDALQEKLKDPALLRKEVNELMFSATVKVSLPKLKIETETNLLDVLVQNGVTKVFDKEHARLDRLLKTDEPMYVSKAIQKAFIEINEEGAEAAAANEFEIVLYMSMYTPDTEYEFEADHPFAFYLKYGDITLFEGVFRP